jgi:hypothetical protein
MGIGSYKEAQRYRMRTNKNLTRGFYLDTRRTLDEEPFAWEQPQDAGIMQPETVQEFSDGGVVERKSYIAGGTVASMPKELNYLFKKEYPNKKWADLKYYQRNNLKSKFNRLYPNIKLSESKLPGVSYERPVVLKIV